MDKISIRLAEIKSNLLETKNELLNLEELEIELRKTDFSSKTYTDKEITKSRDTIFSGTNIMEFEEKTTDFNEFLIDIKNYCDEYLISKDTLVIRFDYCGEAYHYYISLHGNFYRLETREETIQRLRRNDKYSNDNLLRDIRVNKIVLSKKISDLENEINILSKFNE